MEYDLQILGTKWEKKAGVWGWASGINQQGQVAGTAIVSLDTPAGYLNGPAIWDPRKKNWPTSPMTPYSPKSYVPGQLFKITSVGNVTMAVGVIGDKAGYAQVPAVVGGALPPILDLSAIGEPEDINNSSVVVGNGSARSFFFKTSPREKTVHWLSPFSGCKGINAAAINDRGDIVGNCDERGFYFFYFTQTMYDVGACWLFDINVNRLAVGSTTATAPKPIFVDLSEILSVSPLLKSIPLPRPYKKGVAMAVNATGTIVGVCGDDEAAFVYYPNGNSWNLNDQLYLPTNYSLIDAQDINDAGQIVGTAVTYDEHKQVTGQYPYVASPHGQKLPFKFRSPLLEEAFFAGPEPARGGASTLSTEALVGLAKARRRRLRLLGWNPVATGKIVEERGSPRRKRKGRSTEASAKKIDGKSPTKRAKGKG